MKKLHDDSAPSGRSAISQDGRLLIFPRYEGTSGILWAKDLRTGLERQLAVTPRTPLNPIISADGLWAAYTVTKVQTGGDAGIGDGYVIETTGGTPRKVCENCQVAAWTHEGQVVFGTEDRRKLIRFDVATGALHELINAAAYHVLFGPDGTWMLFTVGDRERIVRAPVHPDRAAAEMDWTTLLKVGRTERIAGLSPDSSILYVLLESDGFRCLYGMRLDPKTGYAQGTPFPVEHFHDTTLRWGTTSTGNAIASGLCVVDLYEIRGNIWTAQLVRGGSPAQ
jgi:hypothetical protein